MGEEGEGVLDGVKSWMEDVEWRLPTLSETPYNLKEKFTDLLLFGSSGEESGKEG